MDPLLAACPDSLGAWDAVTYHFVGVYVAAVFPHQGFLFLLCFWDEHALGFFHKASGSKISIGPDQGLMQAGSAEPCPFIIFFQFNHRNIHSVQDPAHSVLFSPAVIAAPAVLQGHGLAVKIRKGKFPVILQSSIEFTR